MYLDLEPDFVEYDRITLNVAPKFLKEQLQVKGRKLKQLEAKYGQVVKLKQAEPAICALYKIGLGYKRFAQTLYDAPIPREYPGQARARGRVQGAARAGRGAARAEGGRGARARDERLARLRRRERLREAGDRDPREVQAGRVRALARGAAAHRAGARSATSPRGLRHPRADPAGPRPRRRPAPVRRAEAALPPLRVTPAATQRAEPRARSADPQERVVAEEPLPSRKERKKAQEEDEDLLP